MEGKDLALKTERSWRRKETAPLAPPPPPPPPIDPPPSLKPKKRSTYGQQRDYRVLEREKKVSGVLEDHDFRAKLEGILQGQLEGKNRQKPTTRPTPDQWLADLRLQPGSRQPVAAGWEAVMPINDLNGTNYTMAERERRCQLAAVFRLVELFGWSQLIHNHITARVPGNRGGYYVNAFGLLYAEVTASNLVHIGLEGDIIDPGTTQLGVNTLGLALHSAIHTSKEDIVCAIHLHNTASVAVSAMNCGLLPISSEANAIGKVSYCDLWELEREDVKAEIARTLGSASKVLVLHNNGVVAMGESVEEAFGVAHSLVKACDIQVAAMVAGIGNVTPNAHQGVWQRSKAGGLSLPSQGESRGELQFEALMRMLDNKGYKTGYKYKGLDLLQPADKKTKSPLHSTAQKHLPELQTSEQGDTELANIKFKAKKPAQEQGKELWEFLEPEEDRKVPNGPAKKSRLPVQEDDLECSVDTATQRGDDLNSLRMMAEKVARSTRDAMQKLVLKGKDLSLLEQVAETAQCVAKSTGDALQTLTSNREETLSSNGGDLQQTVENVARSTANALQLVTGVGQELVESDVSSREEEGEQDLLEMARRTAKQVAQSTSDSVKRLADQKEEEEEVLIAMARRSADCMDAAMVRSNRDHHVHAEMLSDAASSSWLDALTRGTGSANNTGEDCEIKAHEMIRVTNGDGNFLHIYPTQLPDGDVRRMPLLPAALLGYVINGSRQPPLTPSMLPHPVTNGNDTRKLPLTPSILPQLVTNDDTRKLPLIPSILPQLVTNGSKLHSLSQPLTNGYSTKQLPLFSPVPPQCSTDSPKGHQVARQPAERLTNGYQHLTNGLKKDAWTKSADSDSEYSTTESVDFAPQLRMPVHQEAWPIPYSSDLKTDPMKRTSHTAEMVAESTGKAVHRLTSTLSER